MPHSHPIYDSDKHFVIDPITRNIINNSSKLTIMQYDHNSERFTFEIPKIIEGHDMSLSDAVRVHFINIGSIKTNTNSGVYEVDDVAVSLDDPDTVTFSWLISGASTEFNGSLNFAIRFYCVSDEGIIEYSWGTNIYSGINIANSFDNSEAIAEDYVDVLEQWKRSLRVETIEANTAARHTHDNKTLLDSITEADKTAWNTADEWVSANGANILSHLSDDAIFNGGTVDDSGYLHLQLDGEDIDGFTPFFVGFGGGGSSSAGYTITFQNRLPSRSITTAGGSAVDLKYQYTSVDPDGVDDGDGIGTLTVNGASVATVSVPQGESTLDVAQYLTSGANTVKLKVQNSEGSSRTLSYTITVVTLTMTTTIDTMAVYSAATTFNYTVSGSGVKTVHILMDGTELGTEEVSSSGRSRSYAIPAQSDGAHILTAYAETTVSDTTVRSNTLTVGMMFVSDAMSDPAILTTFSQKTATQGEILSIPYMVYDPQNLSASVTLKVLNPDWTEYSSKSITAGREAQTWTVQDYPAGTVTLRIVCGSVYKDCAVTVAESTVNVEPVTDALALCFDPSGRSNLESNPANWSSGGVSATFTGVGFSAADGWLTDSDGASVLRLLPGSSMTIPYYLFQNDARTSGVTVEVEMATHNVRDYDSIVMSCMSGNRGFKIASQYAEIASEQSSVSMQFKEDEKVRVSFVVEPRNLHRMIYVYVDGIMCGAVQYPENDDFSQSTAVGITVGAESSGIDVYKVRLYTKGLTRHEILDNYIADRPLLSDRVEALRRNDVLDLSENIVVSKLPATLPYMIIQCEQLPQSKGDEKTCAITYVNLADSSRSFTAENVKIDVQGTSSAGYKKKNFKLKLKGGVTYTANNVQSDSYLLREDSVPAAVFCMKADVASSESANNVELARLYNDIVPHKTSAQETDSRVRVAIDGTPCVIFWQNTATNETRFWGKYNFNFDKGASDVFGLSNGCESWETLNNTSNRTIYKSADFSGTAWQDDFEARYPSKNTDCTKLQAMCEWVVSTDRTAATGNALEASATYEGVEYTTDSAEYRLAKFKAEFEDHFVKAPMLFYYLFTEVFLMVDSRAKNFFPTTFDGTHWFPFPYDFDTALGINNEGQLVFDYDLEDTDTVGGHNVFNGQASVLWCNIRDAFASDIKAMYQTLRNGAVFGYDTVAQRFAAHQAVWPETVWNEDAWEKYLEPLENDNDGSYLTMLQGSKSSQREWWLFNAFRYRDSKYQCGDASREFITLRCYAVGDITVTPYSHIWPRIKYGSYTVTERGKRNTETTLVCPLDTMDDTEVYIYSADRIASIGDLSAMQVGYADFSMATKLQSLKLGDGASTYENTRLTELYVGNNELLTTLDVQNCVALSMAVDLSGCVGIQTIKAKGSAATGFTLPVGGKLATLELPETITNLTIRDQSHFTTLDMDGYTALTTLRIENTPNVPLETIINGAANLNRVRLIGVEWDETSEETLQTTIDKLETCIGMDASGNNTAAAVVTGRVNVPSISSALLTEINEAFPELVVVANGEPQYLIRFLDYDNSVLYRQVVAEGGDAVNPVTAGYITAPTRMGTEDSGYVFRDFGTLPTNVHSNGAVYAVYDTTYRVQFMNDSTVYDTQWIVSGESATTPTPNPTKASTAQYTYTFSNWDKSYTNVTEPLTVNAVYTSTVRTYTVKFYNGSTLLQTVTDVPYGSSASYTGDTPFKTEVDDPTEYVFTGFSPDGTSITGDTNCYAVYRYTGLISVKLVERSLSGDCENDTVEHVGIGAFYGCTSLTSVSFPAATSIGYSAFYGCSGLTSGVSFPVATIIGREAFAYCSSLTSVSFPAATAIGKSAFYNCYSLTSVSFPAATTIGSFAFRYCTSLTTASFSVASNIGDGAFYGCTSLSALILGASSVCYLRDENALSYTPIASGTGYIYVPSSLVASYQEHYRWGYFSSQISAIEDSEFGGE